MPLNRKYFPIQAHRLLTGLRQTAVGLFTWLERKFMKNFGPQWLAVASLVSGLGMPTGAQASWTFSDSGVANGITSTGAAGGASEGNKATLVYNKDATSLSGESAATLTLSGAYAVNNGANNSLTAGAVWVTSTAGTPYQTTGAQLNYYGPAGQNGIGMASDGSAVPNHAMDNSGNTESMLLSFNSSVVLTSIGLGYISGDADISLFRYTGTVAPSLTGVGATLSGMNSAGWELVGNYADLVSDTTDPYNLVNGSAKGSSWWLISAYNSAYGSTPSNGGTLSNGDDYFKVYAVSGTSCAGSATGSTGVGSCAGLSPAGSDVPEPNSMALLAIAGLGMVGARRRLQKQGAAA